MKIIKLSFVASLFAGVLTACSTTGVYDSPAYRLPEGSTVELTKPLKFPYQSTRTFIQGGESLHWGQVNHYAPFCSFGLNRKRDGEPLMTDLPPTRFSTSQVNIGVEARADVPQPFQVAGRGSAGWSAYVASQGGAMDSGNGSPWPYRYYTTIELYSDEAPQVDDLTCAYDGERYDRNLTLDQIRDTLGDLVRIY